MYSYLVVLARAEGRGGEEGGGEEEGAHEGAATEDHSESQAVHRGVSMCMSEREGGGGGGGGGVGELL